MSFTEKNTLRRRPAGERGVAMVEGIAVIPVFILFWLGTAALERMYTA